MCDLDHPLGSFSSFQCSIIGRTEPWYLSPIYGSIISSRMSLPISSLRLILRLCEARTLIRMERVSRHFRNSIPSFVTTLDADTTAHLIRSLKISVYQNLLSLDLSRTEGLEYNLTVTCFPQLRSLVLGKVSPPYSELRILSNLTHLDLFYSLHIAPLDLEGLPLESIVIRDSPRITGSCLASLSSLRSLALDRSFINSRDVAQLTNLTHLDLTKNYTFVPDRLTKLTSLKSLILNQARSPPLDGLSLLTNLTYLSLDSVYSSSDPITDRSIAPLTNLRTLNISNPFFFMHITSSQLRTMTNLKSLSLSSTLPTLPSSHHVL